MDAKSIIAALDAEIEALRGARAILLNSDNAGSTAAKKAAAKPRKTAKRVLSPEARKRIADAQRKRWAAARKPKQSATAAPAKATKKAVSRKKSAQRSAKKAVAKKTSSAISKKAVVKKAAPPKPEASKTETAAS